MMRWLLQLLLTKDDRRAIEADLAELAEIHRRQHGDRAAERWMRRQLLIYPLHLLAERARGFVSAAIGGIPSTGRDIVYSARSLARTPALTLTIMLTVGIGLGATTAMLAVVRGVLVNPLPYAASDNLYWIYTDTPPFRFRFTVVDYRALEADHPAFSAVAGYQTSAVTVLDRSGPDRVNARSVTGSYFPLMGQRAAFGRLFEPADDTGTDRIAVLTAPYWTRRLGGDPAVIGRTIRINGIDHTIVGVLEPVNGPLERDIAMFTAARWPEPRRKGPFFTTALARLRPGASLEEARQTLRATNARLFPIWKTSYQDEKSTWGLQDLKSRVVGETGSTLTIVLVAVGCVLLIACVNAINLLMARAVDRNRDLAIRTALGASRWRVLRTLIVESGLLSLGSAVVGAAITVVSLGAVAQYGVGYIPRAGEVGVTPEVVGWLALLTAASGAVMLVGGLLPSVPGAARLFGRTLGSGQRSTESPATRGVRHALVAAQFALATPLLISAALVLASLDRLSRVPVGLDTERLLTGAVSLSGPGYAQESDRKAFWERAVARLSALPGVTAVAVADSRPPNEAGNTNNFDLEDHPTPPGQSQPLATWVGVSPGFFQATGLRLERGRLLDERSLQERVIVVDRAWADRFFPGEEVLGRRLKSGGCTTCPWTTVVGVVGSVKWVGLEKPDPGTVYYPFVDLPNAFLVVRAAGEPQTLMASVREAVRELDPSLALANLATGDDLVSSALTTPRYLTVIVGMFALAAVLLSVIGIYGVMAHFVHSHTRDIGIRLALGGEPAHVRRMIVWRGLRLVTLGVVVGVAIALVSGRLLSTNLFEIGSTDPAMMTAVPAALIALAAIGCLVPGRRAARLDPAEILREG